MHGHLSIGVKETLAFELPLPLHPSNEVIHSLLQLLLSLLLPLLLLLLLLSLPNSFNRGAMIGEHHRGSCRLSGHRCDAPLHVLLVDVVDIHIGSELALRR
uniref:Uncharacterized protein n=1 Tax=Triticum urartu TaxID=4572 RepID=A0A8R7TZT4_TRIUA